MKNKDFTPIPLDEAARLLAVSVRTVRRLIDNGQLKAVRIGPTLALAPTALPEPLRRALLSGRDDRLLTLHDVAARLGFPPVRVKKLTEDGILKVVDVGRSSRWSCQEIDAFSRRRTDHDQVS